MPKELSPPSVVKSKVTESAQTRGGETHGSVNAKMCKKCFMLFINSVSVFNCYYL